MIVSIQMYGGKVIMTYQHIPDEFFTDLNNLCLKMVRESSKVTKKEGVPNVQEENSG